MPTVESITENQIKKLFIMIPLVYSSTVLIIVWISITSCYSQWNKFIPALACKEVKKKLWFIQDLIINHV